MKTLLILLSVATLVFYYLAFRISEPERKAIRKRSRVLLENISAYSYMDFWRYVTGLSRRFLYWINFNKKGELSIAKTYFLSCGVVFIISAVYASSQNVPVFAENVGVSEIKNAVYQVILKPLLISTMGIHLGYMASVIISIKFLDQMRKANSTDFVVYWIAEIVVAYGIATLVSFSIVTTAFLNSSQELSVSSLSSLLLSPLLPFVVVYKAFVGEAPFVYLMFFAVPVIPTAINLGLVLLLAALKWPFDFVRREIVVVLSRYTESDKNEFAFLAGATTALASVVAAWLV